MKKSVIFLFLSLYSAMSFSQAFPEKTVLLSNTEASLQSHVIVAANFGPNKNYFVKHLRGIIKVFDIQNDQEIELSTTNCPPNTNIVGFQDFNNDGRIDILTDYGPMYNLGDEIFSEIDFPDGANLVGRVRRYFDFNGDGLLDIIGTFPGSPGTLSIYLINDKQEVTNTIRMEDEDGFEVIRIGDYNQDGTNDIVYIADKFGGDRLVFLENQEDTTFQSAELTSFSRNRSLLFLTDLDVDGDLDIISPANRDIDWVENIDGNLSSIESLIRGTTVQSMDIADFDNNGYPDIVVLDDSDFLLYKVFIYFNNGDGTFQDAIQIGEITGFSPISIVIRSAFENWIQAQDINNDGWPDVLVNEIANGNYLAFFNQMPTSVTNLDNTKAFEYYPNPTQDYLMIKSNEPLNEDYHARIYSSSGQLMLDFKNFNIHSARFDLNDLRSGVYFFELINLKNGHKTIEKIIKP